MTPGSGDHQCLPALCMPLHAAGLSHLAASFTQIFNISGERFVTFDGIAKACAKAAGASEPELVHFNPKSIDLGGAKAFPLRDQHFFASVDKVLLSWMACQEGRCDGSCMQPQSPEHVHYNPEGGPGWRQGFPPRRPAVRCPEPCKACSMLWAHAC